MATRELEVQRSRGVVHAEGVNLSDPERWISALGGGALAAYGLKRKDLVGAAIAVAGSTLVARGLTGHCPVNEAVGRNTANRPRYALKVMSTYTVMSPPERLYQFWHTLDNLPKFMTHLKSVQDLGNGRSHWIATGPAGKDVEWDAEIINDVQNETIAWKSLEGSDIDNAGAVRFQPAPGGRGTEVHVTLEYNPPGGKAGALLAKLFGEEPEVQVSEDLRHFKQIMEAGEIPTIEGQPTGKAPAPQESILTAMAHPSR